MKLKIIKSRKKFSGRKKSECLQLVSNFFREYSLFPERIHFVILHLKVILTRKFGKSWLKSHCIISGRARAIFRSERMSRIVIRNFLRNGLLTGWTKNSF